MAYTAEQKKTLRAIRSAFKSKKLGPTGACKYLDINGNRCIVGTILHNYGLNDTILVDGLNFSSTEEDNVVANEIPIGDRDDIHDFIKSKGLDLDLLRQTQSMFDNSFTSSAAANANMDLSSYIIKLLINDLKESYI